MNPGVHAAIAAAHKRRQEQEEEEKLTRYTAEELSGDWEFKIVRSDFPVFGRPANFQRLLEEESMGGWQLVEKLDNQRVRFKRPTKARQNDPLLQAGYDPYRTKAGSASGAPVLLGALIGLVAVIAIGALVLFFGKDSIFPLTSKTIFFALIIIGAFTITFPIFFKRMR